VKRRLFVSAPIVLVSYFAHLFGFSKLQEISLPDGYSLVLKSENFWRSVLRSDVNSQKTAAKFVGIRT